MSRKGGIFREKHSPQKGNVLKIATKRGGNLSHQQNILISPPKCGGNHRAKKNVPETATKRGENLSQQQNILISPPKRGGNHRAKKNVLKTATKPGETAAAEKECPGNHHKTWRNHLRRKKCPGNRHKTGERM